jgi:hypothetical protein
MSSNLTVVERVLRVCGWLRRGLKRPGVVPAWRLGCGFARLQLLVERLPPNVTDASDLGYIRNRVASSRRLAEDGERAAARYQLREFRRKLRARADS